MIATSAQTRFPSAAEPGAASSDAGMAALRRILAVDGVTGIAMGALLTPAAAALAPWLGLPQALLFWAGVLLFPCAALMLATARMPRPAPLLTWVVIVGNAAWVLGSAYVAFGPLEPTVPGRLFVVAQALVVSALTVLEWRALRRAH